MFFFEPKTESKYIPFVTFPESHPKLKSNLKYKIQAGGGLPSNFTGLYMGVINFIDGIAEVDKHFYLKEAEMKGCIDITSEETKQLLKERPLNRILLSRAAAFGDNLIFTPALKALRKKYPNALIHLISKKGSKVIFEYSPYIDAILQIREIEFGSLINEYDEVYDLVHSIECKPEADYMNSLDVAHKIIHLDPPVDTRPTYTITNIELGKATELLLKMQVDPQKDKIIVFQAEATAMVRTLPFVYTFAIADQLALLGYKVVMVGHNPSIVDVKRYKCSNCNVSIVKNDFIDVSNTECGHCHKKGSMELFELNKNIVFTHSYLDKYQPREIFAIGHFMKLHIGVDSFWSHLAAALNKPSVTIFTNYHPYTRLKYYDNTSVITAPSDLVKCGPCNSLYNECPLYPNQIPPCIKHIDTDEVIKEVKKRLDGFIQLYNPLKDKQPVVLIEDTECPYCNHKENRPVTAKGDVIYVQCTKCNSFYVQKDYRYSNLEIRQALKKSSYYRLGRNIKLVDYIKAIENILLKTNKFMPSLPIVDLIKFPDSLIKKNPHEKESWIRIVNEDKIPSLDSQLIIWIDGLMEYMNPIKKLEEIRESMIEDGYLAIISPIVEKYDRLNTWAPLNNILKGLVKTVPSSNAIYKLFHKENGTHKHMFHIVGFAHSDNRTIFLLQKVKAM